MADKEESKYIRDLKKQILKLRRENQQLRKSKRLAEQLAEIKEEVYDEEMEAKFLPLQADKVDVADLCPKCHSSEMVKMILRDLPYYHCPDCGSRGRLKSSK
jgi:ssDNA-binding Zn-finger/Zn-ribbon topoisomerase 1